jgi:hypothetical protein
MRIIIILLFPLFCFSQYRIDKSGSTITAKADGLPSFVGTDAKQVIQSAINYLTPKGPQGSGGGKIILGSGTFNLTDEINIIGWEGGALNNGSQIIIEGQGLSTKIIQTTPGKNGIVAKNAASFVLKDLFIYTHTNSKSCLLADNTGTETEISCVRSKIDNVLFQSSSTTSPAVYLKNFFDLSAPFMTADNANNDGMIIENNSMTTNYGAGLFGYLRCIGSQVKGFAGLRFRNVGNTNFTNNLVFSYFMCIGAYYGIYSEGLKFSTFNHIDIEGMPYPVYFSGTSSGYNHETQNVNITGGIIIPTPKGAAITNTVYSNGNDFSNIQIEGDSTIIPILDQQQYRFANSYSLICPAKQAARVSIKTANTPIRVTKSDGTIRIK